MGGCSQGEKWYLYFLLRREDVEQRRKETIRLMFMLICDDDDAATVGGIGGFWHEAFNKDFCRTSNDSMLHATANINPHHDVPQLAVLLRCRRLWQ